MISCVYIGKDIISDNQLVKRNNIKKNKKLKVKYVKYIIKKGETLYRISKNYHVPIEVLADINDIEDATKIYVGQVIKIPVNYKYKKSKGISSSKRLSNNIKKGNNAIKRVDNDISFLKRWPLNNVSRKNIIKKYGRIYDDELKVFTNNNGIDIKAEKDKIIYATNSGTVTYIDFIKGLGNMIALKVRGDYYIFYYPFENIFVKKGDNVNEGARLGTLRGEILHFEVRKKRQPLNPLLFLP